MKVNFLLPTDTTVRSQVEAICKELHRKVVKELDVSPLDSRRGKLLTCRGQAVKSKISYSTDTWTTKQMVFSFCGVIGSWIDDDWNLIERLIDFRHLEQHEHKGKHGAKAFVESARKRGHLDLMSIVLLLNTALIANIFALIHFLALTMDNVSSNDVLARTLGQLLTKYDVEFDPVNGQIRCMPHVINLVVQKILSVLCDAQVSSDSVADPDVEDYHPTTKRYPVHYDPSEDADLAALEEEYDHKNTDSVQEKEDSDEDFDDDDDDDDGGEGEDEEGAPKPKKSKEQSPIIRVRINSLVVYERN